MCNFQGSRTVVFGAYPSSSASSEKVSVTYFMLKIIML